MLVRVVEIVYAGDQLVFSRSRQISPVWKCTFGWQIGVTNLISGGVFGYVGGILMSSSQQPPAWVKLCQWMFAYVTA